MNSDTLEVHVNLSERSYDIEIGTNTLSSVGSFITKKATITHAILISDENVAKLYAETVERSLKEAGIRVSRLDVTPGEKSKSIEVAADLWNKALADGADRKSVVIALGGGVVGDLAGFIAATFTRGLDFYQAPTSLLAQVDSSVGGKVGINLPTAKNMVGAFWQPQAVLIDTEVLNTLSDREYRAGLAEVVKYGVILDEEFFSYLEQHTNQINNRDAETLRYIVAKCCQLKAYVVENDERETTGLRAVLNYGHTFCHAFESVGGYGKLLHGEAVSIGMLCASRLAELMLRIPQQATKRQYELLNALQIPVRAPELDRKLLLAAMQKDKKVEHGKLRFVLPTKIGHVELVSDVSPDLADQAIADTTT